MNEIRTNNIGITVPIRRLYPKSQNALSIATLISIGDFSILLGADVENSKNKKSGWQNIVESRKNFLIRPHVFKAAHHGSENSHSEELWGKVLNPRTTVIVTPFLNGKTKLPTQSGLNRLKELSTDIYITSTGTTKMSSMVNAQHILATKDQNIFFDSLILDYGSVALTIDAQSGLIKNVQLTGSSAKI